MVDIRIEDGLTLFSITGYDRPCGQWVDLTILRNQGDYFTTSIYIQPDRAASIGAALIAAAKAAGWVEAAEVEDVL